METKQFYVRMDGNSENLLNAIRFLEINGQMPMPIKTALMLDFDEIAYSSIPTNWSQPCAQTKGKTITSGILYVTSKRLIFSSDTRNTSIRLNKILDCNFSSDCLRVDKNIGKPDCYTMSAIEARFVRALVGALKKS